MQPQFVPVCQHSKRCAKSVSMSSLPGYVFIQIPPNSRLNLCWKWNDTRAFGKVQSISREEEYDLVPLLNCRSTDSSCVAALFFDTRFLALQYCEGCRVCGEYPKLT